MAQFGAISLIPFMYEIIGCWCNVDSSSNHKAALRDSLETSQSILLETLLRDSLEAARDSQKAIQATVQVQTSKQTNPIQTLYSHIPNSFFIANISLGSCWVRGTVVGITLEVVSAQLTDFLRIWGFCRLVSGVSSFILRESNLYCFEGLVTL